MTAKEKERVLNAPCVAYCVRFPFVRIKGIENGINDYVLFTEGIKFEKVHKVMIHYGERPYFRVNGKRVNLDECLRCG